MSAIGLFNAVVLCMGSIGLISVGISYIADEHSHSLKWYNLIIDWCIGLGLAIVGLGVLITVIQHIVKLV